MNKRRLTLLLTACVTALNLTLAAALSPQAESADFSPSVASAAPTADEGESGGYLLLAVEGKVCVYQDGVLLMETGIDVSLLPAADRADLAAGIHASDAVALASYLEDFGA